MPHPRSSRATSAVTITSALAVVVLAFMPWYETALGPTRAPDAVSGWDGSAWVKLAVLGAVICALSSAVVVLDIRTEVALHGPVRRILAGIALGCALVTAICVVYRFAVPPNAAIDATRQAALILAVFAAVIGLWGAASQFSRTFPERRATQRARLRPRARARSNAPR
jgi:hypothetical protein